MRIEYIQQLSSLLGGDNPDRYEAFKELKNAEKSIDNLWKENFKAELENYLSPVLKKFGNVWQMSMGIEAPFEIYFYLAEYGKGSLSLAMWYEWFTLNCENEIVKNKVANDKDIYIVLANALGLNPILKRDLFEGGERGQYVFGSKLDNKFTDISQLWWYVGNRSADFARQVAAKVDRFINNPDVENVVRQINQKVLDNSLEADYLIATPSDSQIPNSEFQIPE